MSEIAQPSAGEVIDASLNLPGDMGRNTRVHVVQLQKMSTQEGAHFLLRNLALLCTLQSWIDHPSAADSDVQRVRPAVEMAITHLADSLADANKSKVYNPVLAGAPGIESWAIQMLEKRGVEDGVIWMIKKRIFGLTAASRMQEASRR